MTRGLPPVHPAILVALFVFLVGAPGLEVDGRHAMRDIGAYLMRAVAMGIFAWFCWASPPPARPVHVVVRVIVVGLFLVSVVFGALALFYEWRGAAYLTAP